VITRIAPELKTELVGLAKQHGRSVAAETRHALSLWCHGEPVGRAGANAMIVDVPGRAGRGRRGRSGLEA
jgi:hypothetical protein